jgi:adenine-specific DNA-methyltransferase
MNERLTREKLIEIIFATRGDEKWSCTESAGYHYLFAVGGCRGLFLVWNEHGMGDLTKETFQVIFEEARRAGIEPPFVVYAHYELLFSNSVLFHKTNKRTGLDSLLLP